MNFIKKRWKILVCILLILSVIGVFLYFYISSFKVDRQETLALMKEVNEDYPKFNKNMTEFVNKRNAFYKQKEEIYLEDMGKNTAAWITFMNEYAKIIENIESSSKRLKGHCKNNFGDINAKTQCNQFRVNYEAANNYYITDIKAYNNIVKEYNEWLINHSSSYPKLNEISLSIYKDYIDYDEDGEYFGKEVSK